MRAYAFASVVGLLAVVSATPTATPPRHRRQRIRRVANVIGKLDLHHVRPLGAAVALSGKEGAS